LVLSFPDLTDLSIALGLNFVPGFTIPWYTVGYTIYCTIFVFWRFHQVQVINIALGLYTNMFSVYICNMSLGFHSWILYQV
jgi:hypothetical protein